MMPPPSQPLTYDEVTEIYRREQKNKNVTEIRKDFYPAIRDFVEKLRNETENEMAIDQYSPRATLLRNQLKKVCDKAIQIFDFRVEKIILAALRAAGGSKFDIERLTPEERELYSRVYASIIECRSSAVGFDQRSKCGSIQHRIDATEKAVKPKQSESRDDLTTHEQLGSPLRGTAAASESQEVLESRPEGATGLRAQDAETYLPPIGKQNIISSRDWVLVRILEDLPTFAGPSRDYTLRKEDVVTLPSSIARLLIDKGKAEEIIPRLNL
ncbi:MAG: hypothetical protein QW083_02775 [Methanomassiliicoccales archaeon]